MLLLLLGCTLIPDTRLPGLSADSPAELDSDSPSDSGSDSAGPVLDDTAGDCVTPSIAAVDPPWGTNAGGVEVTVWGEGLDHVDRVELDGEVAEVVQQSESELVLRTPATPGGDVDLMLASPCGQDAAPWQTFPDATGRGGAIGRFEWNEYIGGYWYDVHDYGRAWFAITEAFDAHYWDIYADADDECLAETRSLPVKVVYEGTVKATATLTGSGITMNWSNANLYWQGDFGASQWAYDADVRMDALSGGPLDGLEMDVLAKTPTRLSVTSPALAGSYMPELTRHDLHFTWDTVPADRIVIEMGYAPDRSNVESAINCVVVNDGAFTVPADTWPEPWQAGALVFTRVSAYREGGGTVSLHGGESRVVGGHTVTGAIYTVGG